MPSHSGQKKSYRAPRAVLRRILGITLIVGGLSMLMSGLGAAFLH